MKEQRIKKYHVVTLLDIVDESEALGLHSSNPLGVWIKAATVLGEKKSVRNTKSW